MNEQQLELQTVEASIEDAKEYLQFSESEKVLSEDKNFKVLIIDGYMRDEAARLAGLLAEPSMVDEVNQRELQSALKAISHLKQYLLHVRRTRIGIEDSLSESEAYADELRESE